MKKFTMMWVFLLSTAAFAQGDQSDGGERGTKDDPSTSNIAINAPASVRGGGDSYGTDFEGSEGFTPGFLGTQGGWSTFVVSTMQPIIDNSNASSGSQALMIDVDGTIGAGNLTGGFSPQITPADPMAPSVASANFFITGTGGADYDFAPQAPSQGFLTARVNFRFTGPIRVLDGGGFVDTGVTWPVNEWFNVRVEVDPNIPQIDYYLNDSLIYTATELVGGTTVEQVVWISDNFHFGETGAMDQLSFGAPGIPIPTMSEWAMIGFISLLLAASLVVMRKRRQV